MAKESVTVGLRPFGDDRHHDANRQDQRFTGWKADIIGGHDEHDHPNHQRDNGEHPAQAGHFLLQAAGCFRNGLGQVGDAAKLGQHPRLRKRPPVPFQR